MPIGQWMVYLVECADGTLYCGTTACFDRRLRQHNGKIAGGAKYTRTRRPVKPIVCVPCASRSEALRLECAVRTRRRSEKIAFLKSLI